MFKHIKSATISTCLFLLATALVVTVTHAADNSDAASNHTRTSESGKAPSAKEVISAFTNGLNVKDNEALAELKNATSSLELEAANASKNLEQCITEASTNRCYAAQNGRGIDRKDDGVALYENVAECKGHAESQCESAVSYTKQRVESNAKAIGNPYYRSQAYVFKVEAINNYEGNIIAGVTARKKGTDESCALKVHFKPESHPLEFDYYTPQFPCNHEDWIMSCPLFSDRDKCR